MRARRTDRLDVVDRSADFPMELFLLMGDDYRDDPVIGHAVRPTPARRAGHGSSHSPGARARLGGGRGRAQCADRCAQAGVIAPDRPNVLITSAARKVLLVRAFADALARTGSGRVIAADIDPLAAALYAADAGRLIPRSDEPSFLDALLGICADDRVGLIVPTRDEELPILARAASRLEAAGTRVLVSAADAVDTCRDKRRFVDAVRAAGLTAPAVYDDPTGVSYPAFVKPRLGKGGRGATRVNDATALAAAVKAIEALGEEALIQAFVEAPEFTVDVFIDFEAVKKSGMPLFIAATNVHTGRLRVFPREKIDADAVMASAALPYVFKAVEIDGVPYGTQPALWRRGQSRLRGRCSNPDYAVRAARGRRLESRLDDYEAGLVMLRHSADLFVREDALLGADDGA